MKLSRHAEAGSGDSLASIAEIFGDHLNSRARPQTTPKNDTPIISRDGHTRHHHRRCSVGETNDVIIL